MKAKRFNDMEALVEDLTLQIQKKESGINYQLRPNLTDEILRLKHELGETLSRERVLHSHKLARLKSRLESYSRRLNQSGDQEHLARLIREEFPQ